MVFWSLVNRYHHCTVSIFRSESRPHNQKGLQIRGSKEPRLGLSVNQQETVALYKIKHHLGRARNFADWLSRYWGSRFQGQCFLLICSQPWPWSTLLYIHMFFILHSFFCTSTHKMGAAVSSTQVSNHIAPHGINYYQILSANLCHCLPSGTFLVSSYLHLRST
jgi:hypothetical protein